MSAVFRVMENGAVHIMDGWLVFPREKKIAMGHKPDDHEEGQTM